MSEQLYSESMDNYKEALDASFRDIQEGDIVTGTVIGVTEEEVTVDLQYYTQGVIPAANLSNDPGFSILRDVKLEDSISATVVRMDDGQGNILLSVKEAVQVLSWDKLREYESNQTNLTVSVTDAVNAGVIAYVEGIRGFIPASQLSLDYVEDCSEWVGKKLQVRVITVDEAKQKLVLSAKVILKEEAEAAHHHAVAMMIPGTVMEGIVETIMPYGAFISLGNGLSGLVHISQICQKRISSPNEVLKVGQTVTVKILNTNDGKISLSMKALEDIQPEETPDIVDEPEETLYTDGEAAATSLADLLKNFKL
ncbi:MAG: S1 RNA-binding domain-containing protein [Lachnospiraceae bacterium]